jgi:uracil-DNA glycosylase
MDVRIDSSWKDVLAQEFEKNYFLELRRKVKREYQDHQCFPPGKEIFTAFNLCPLDQVKVVIIGQDPYHGENQANGLCFSVKEGITHPPSLKNILKELENDLNMPYPITGDLSQWAAQGVLLLNTILTVRAHEPGSHKDLGWEDFTNAVIKSISNSCDHVVFLLWGGYAKKKATLIDTQKHTILTSGHPSPLSANRGYWFGNKHFSKTNDLLKRMNKQEIDWSLGGE